MYTDIITGYNCRRTPSFASGKVRLPAMKKKINGEDPSTLYTCSRMPSNLNQTFLPKMVKIFSFWKNSTNLGNYWSSGIEKGFKCAENFYLFQLPKQMVPNLVFQCARKLQFLSLQQKTIAPCSRSARFTSHLTENECFVCVKLRNSQW